MSGLGLVVLAALVLALTFAAMQKARPHVPTAGETPGYDSNNSFSDLDNQQSGDAQPEEESDEQVAAYTVPGQARLLAVQTAELAYRAVTGPCPEAGAAVEVTWDGGATWEPSDLGALHSLAGMQNLRVFDDGEVYALGFNPDDCSEVTAASSWSQGSEWQPTEAKSWWFPPQAATTLRGPAGQSVEPGCSAARVAASGDALAVLCTNGSLAASADAGATWAMSAPKLGSQETALVGGRIVLLSADTEACDGLQFQTMGLDLALEEDVCVPGLSGPFAFSAQSEDVMWVWAGEQMLKSTNGGQTWE